MMTGQINLAWSDTFIAALAAAGLRHCVLAPGARSAPPMLAALRRPELTCHVVNDERAAGFFALGIGKATGLPAAVLTTSGTAAANLMPAIMEANLARVPLLALTADRPPEALGWGANQTVDQIKLYGDQVRAFHALPTPSAAIDGNFLHALASRLVQTTKAPLPGPVHANLPFREPLLPERIPAPPSLPAICSIPACTPALPADLATLAGRLSGRTGVIVCGEARYPANFGAVVARLAATLEAPVLAEALSNLRCGPHDQSRFVTHAARFLRQSDLPRPDWVLRFGGFPVSRAIERWLAGLNVTEHLFVAVPGDWTDPLWQHSVRIEGDPFAVATALASLCRPASTDFLKEWLAAEKACPENTIFFEGRIVRTLVETLPANTRVFVGNSLAMRALDAFGGSRATPLTLYGNRGASGIDGNLATCAGIAAASGQPVAALVGDQTLLHDASSLALLAGRDAIIVLLDNGGGRIFDHLPFAAALPEKLLSSGWHAPGRVGFADLARAYGLQYAIARSQDDLAGALQQAESNGPWLVRAIIDPAVSRAGFAV
jgi:2-succinyl-5-enolpyruvyl-6-hydroxy-3-cyclohexene-1-carboxylate synthase